MNNRVIAFSIYKRRYKEYNDRALDGYFLEFRDLLTNKVYHQEKVDTKEFNRLTDALSLKNGALYFIGNKRRLYSVNKQSFTIEDVTDDLVISRHPEFGSGIAEMSLNINDGDSFGLEIMTNLGKEIFYYPEVDKIYMSSGDHWNARKKKNTLLPNTTEKNYFVFTKKSTDFKDQPVQLIKAVYKSNNGGPEDLPLPEWRRDYTNGRSGIFIINENTPYIKRLFPKDSRIISFTDLTPDRLYFDPKVLFYDDHVVVIKYRPTIAEDAAFILQCLNAGNGEVGWTLNLPEEMKNVNRVVKTSQGFIALQRDENIFLIDNTGQITKEIALPEEGKEE